MAPAELILCNKWHPQFEIPNSSAKVAKKLREFGILVKTKEHENMVFCYQNISDLLCKKIVLVIVKNI